MKLLLKTCLTVLVLFLSENLFSQYILNGTAEKNSCNCYTLTKASDFQNGSVWNANKISLEKPFDFWFNVFLGCSDAGADGIVFMLQPISTSIGTAGEGMGFQGVKPSVGIALDTYQNLNQNDPAEDHISIQIQGIVDHRYDVAGPVPVSATSNNVEDCQWHRLRISWDPATQWLKSWFDGVLRVEKQIDLISTVFYGDPMVYWGFTGATGGENNLQQFCTALNPDFVTDTGINGGCAPASIQFTSQSVSFAPIAEYHWDFGNGNTSNQEEPPLQFYPLSGDYEVKLKIKGMDGCESTLVRKMTIGTRPSAQILVNDTCFGYAPSIVFYDNNIGVKYQWWLDGLPLSGAPLPELKGLSAGGHQLNLKVSSEFGCGEPAQATADFQILPLPEITINKMQQCRSVQFAGIQLDNKTEIDQWRWSFGDGQFSSNQNPLHNYVKPDVYQAAAWAIDTNGCSSEKATILVNAPTAIAFAGRDTTVLKDIPFKLKGSGNGSFEWWPAAGVSDPFDPEPTVTLSQDRQFVLTVTTPEGCVAKDSINIKVMKGPAVYVPNAFTPNGDGRNDVLKPVYVGIVKLERFAIYNRWGQQVFSTATMGQGWDGKLAGLDQVGTFIWIIEAKNYLNRPIILKGSVTIIR